MHLRTLFFALLIVLGACQKESNQIVRHFYNISVHDAVLPVLVKGNTEPNKFIIYINGGPGLTSIDVARADMFGWSTVLERDFAMVYYDERGCGNGQGRVDAERLTLQQFAADLQVVVALLKQQYAGAKIYLLPHSFGGMIAAEYLLHEVWQQEISGWICTDGAFNFDYELSWQYRRQFLINLANEKIRSKNDVDGRWQKALEWCVGNDSITTKDQKNTWRNFIGWPGEGVIPEEIGQLSLRDYLAIGFASSYNPMPAYFSGNLGVVNDSLNLDAEGKNLIDSVGRILLPTLFLWGRYDDLICPEEGKAVFTNVGASDKTFQLMPNSSHEPMLSDPDGFQRFVAAFVEKH
ncbi:alpha/beta fold hydrolase [bacterium]|nr:alpha/beta fold hydrolase [bacterium]